jgi:lipopolysaccharide export system permease protein
MIKLIDKYLIKQFLQTIFFGLIAFTLIFVVIDIMENLDDFIDQSVPGDVVFHYYFVFIPEMLKLITPVAILFAALFTAGKAANLSELTAIKASGVSMFRFMAPFVITTLIISVVNIYFVGYLVPMANKTKHNIEMEYLNRGFEYFGSNLFFQDSKSRIVTISFFDVQRSQANRVSIQEFDEESFTRMVSRIDAIRLVFDSTTYNWIAYNGVRRYFSERRETADYFEQDTLREVNFTPLELQTKQQKPEQMNISELREMIENRRRAGSDPTRALIEYYSRFSFPLASIVVVLFGLPISSNRRKGGFAIQVGIAIMATFIYLVFLKISEAFGKNGALDPMLTAWMPNLLFLAAAFLNFPKMRQ